MPVAGGGFDQCYNAQAAVAAGSLLVVAGDVVQARDCQDFRVRAGD
jgi:heptaprenylglyceryl phosphate synthase